MRLKFKFLLLLTLNYVSIFSYLKYLTGALKKINFKPLIKNFKEEPKQEIYKNFNKFYFKNILKNAINFHNPNVYFKYFGNYNNNNKLSVNFKPFFEFSEKRKEINKELIKIIEEKVISQYEFQEILLISEKLKNGYKKGYFKNIFKDFIKNENERKNFKSVFKLFAPKNNLNPKLVLLAILFSLEEVFRNKKDQFDKEKYLIIDLKKFDEEKKYLEKKIFITKFLINFLDLKDENNIYSELSVQMHEFSHAFASIFTQFLLPGIFEENIEIEPNIKINEFNSEKDQEFNDYGYLILNSLINEKIYKENASFAMIIRLFPKIEYENINDKKEYLKNFHSNFYEIAKKKNKENIFFLRDFFALLAGGCAQKVFIDNFEIDNNKIEIQSPALLAMKKKLKEMGIPNEIDTKVKNINLDIITGMSGDFYLITKYFEYFIYEFIKSEELKKTMSKKNIERHNIIVNKEKLDEIKNKKIFKEKDQNNYFDEQNRFEIDKDSFYKTLDENIIGALKENKLDIKEIIDKDTNNIFIKQINDANDALEKNEEYKNFFENDTFCAGIKDNLNMICSRGLSYESLINQNAVLKKNLINMACYGSFNLLKRFSKINDAYMEYVINNGNLLKSNPAINIYQIAEDVAKIIYEKHPEERKNLDQGLQMVQEYRKLEQKMNEDFVERNLKYSGLDAKFIDATKGYHKSKIPDLNQQWIKAMLLGRSTEEREKLLIMLKNIKKSQKLPTVILK